MESGLADAAGANAEGHLSNQPKTPDGMYLRSIEVENVRAFGSAQTLNLTDRTGSPARWTLILGENGVGKTTLMQVVAAMRPTPAFENDDHLNKVEDAGVPTFVRAELSSHENAEIASFLRASSGGKTRMVAWFEAPLVQPFELAVEIEGKAGKDFDAVVFDKAEFTLNANGPAVFPYPASRHVGHDNLTEGRTRTGVASLAEDNDALYDSEEAIEALAIAARFDPVSKEAVRYEQLKLVVASLLPECSPEGIEWRGPSVAGRDPLQSGVYVQTPSGMTAFSSLSSGYKVTFAFIVDLAWRLYNAFPESLNPFAESVIVLIDEVELHLHPRWQRQIRSQLLRHFPNVQFIATTHSPVVAQETLSAGGNVCVLRWEGGEVHILNDPLPSNEWRYDQVLASELFGFSTDRSPQAEALLEERLNLIRRDELSPAEQARLRELDTFAAKLPTARTPSAQQLEDLMMRFIDDFPEALAK